MGAKETKEEDIISENLVISEFTKITPLENRPCGCLFLGVHIKTGKYCGLKKYVKTALITENKINMIINERSIMVQLYHPFIVNLMHAFQDDDYCYFVEDYCPGGSMSYLIDHTPNGKLSESEAQFYISCILFALEYIHSKGIVHRTVTLDNLLIDYTGYCKLTNFYYACENGKQAISIPNDNANVNDCYIAPEVKQINNLSSFTSDFYSVGVCLYILLTGRTPKSNPKNDLTMIKSSCSTDVNDFLENILVSDQYQRLGCNGGIKQILNHPWMKEYTWSNVRKKDQIPAIHIDLSQTRYNTDKVVIPSVISTSKPNLSDIFKDYNFKETVNVSEEQQLSDLIKSSDITAEFYSGGINQM